MKNKNAEFFFFLLLSPFNPPKIDIVKIIGGWIVQAYLSILLLPFPVGKTTHDPFSHENQSQVNSVKTGNKMSIRNTLLRHFRVTNSAADW